MFAFHILARTAMSISAIGLPPREHTVEMHEDFETPERVQ